MALDHGIGNVGPISPQAVTWLAGHGYEIGRPIRFPLQLREYDLPRAKLAIALNEVEHRPDLAERFSGWENRVEYWHMHDLDLASANTALWENHRQVREFFHRLSGECLK